MIIALTLPAATTAASASTGAQSVAIPDYRAIRDLPDAVERPDHSLRYRVVFTLSKGAGKPGETNPSLEKVARFMNLLAHDGVRPAKGDIVAVCSQALQGNGYTKEQLLPGVRLDDAAIVTVANLQLRGYALIPD